MVENLFSCASFTASRVSVKEPIWLTFTNNAFAVDSEIPRCNLVGFVTNKHGLVDEITEISAGGMPNRVKCLHALVAHSLAVGPGINPVGDDALVRLGNWATKACVKESE